MEQWGKSCIQDFITGHRADGICNITYSPVRIVTSFPTHILSPDTLLVSVVLLTIRQDNPYPLDLWLSLYLPSAPPSSSVLRKVTKLSSDHFLVFN